MSDINESRKIAPDTKWILTVVGAAFAATISVTQYQFTTAKNEQERVVAEIKESIRSTADLVLEKSKATQFTREQFLVAMAQRDAARERLNDQVVTLREDRAAALANFKNLEAKMDRAITLMLDMQNRAMKADAQLVAMLKQAQRLSGQLKSE